MRRRRRQKTAPIARPIFAAVGKAGAVLVVEDEDGPGMC
jgi:hypothetical protein